MRSNRWIEMGKALGKRCQGQWVRVWTSFPLEKKEREEEEESGIWAFIQVGEETTQGDVALAHYCFLYMCDAKRKFEESG